MHNRKRSLEWETPLSNFSYKVLKFNKAKQEQQDEIIGQTISENIKYNKPEIGKLRNWKSRCIK